MIPTIQEQIAKAWNVAHKPNPTLDELFEAIPNTIVVEGVAYQLQVTPLKGGLTFVDFNGVENPSENFFHSEHPNFAEELCSMIRILNENVTDSWTDC